MAADSTGTHLALPVTEQPMNNTDKDGQMKRHHGWAPIVLTLAMVGLAFSANSYTWEGDADGAKLFKTHCASCHGADATGNGPMARALRQAPADLTLIARHNGGMFPTVCTGLLPAATSNRTVTGRCRFGAMRSR
jgi:mono/diheme cytochrome c family protein